MVGFDPLLQHTPQTVTFEPPSEEIFPPQVADKPSLEELFPSQIPETDEVPPTADVVKTGTALLSSFLQLFVRINIDTISNNE